MLKTCGALCFAIALAGCVSMAEAPPPDGLAADPDRPVRKHDPKTLRMRVARAVEGDVGFRTLLDVKLSGATIAGPVADGPSKGLICVLATLETGFIPQKRSALLRDAPTADGGTALNMAVQIQTPYMPDDCARIAGPFPELEQLRNKRRAAQGKSA
jgi:hypothetical protein